MVEKTWLHLNSIFSANRADFGFSVLPPVLACAPRRPLRVIPCAGRHQHWAPSPETMGFNCPDTDDRKGEFPKVSTGGGGGEDGKPKDAWDAQVVRV